MLPEALTPLIESGPASASNVVLATRMAEKSLYRKALIRFVGFSVAAAACLFGSAGTLHWWNGWVVLAFGSLIAILVATVFRKSPDLLEERMNAGKEAKAWDKVIVPVLAGILPILSLVLAGLDKRLGWTKSITSWESAAALPAMAAGIALTLWAMRTNRFFSSHVRIQQNRGHTVIRSGPYAHIRHPGYTGSILYTLGQPILLGSFVAFWVGIAFLVVTVVRTMLEDATLQKELPGYRDYVECVRYRLVPYVW